MKQFLKYFLSIIITVVVLMFILDKLYTTAYLVNDTPRNKVQNVINTKNTHIDFIFLGSSRTENHIDCALVEQLTGKTCLNLGLQGSILKDSRALTYILNANHITFEKLFIQIDYIYNYSNYSPFFRAKVVPFLNTTAIPKGIEKNMELSWHYNIPFLKYAINDKVSGIREVFMQIIERPVNLDLNNGFVPLEGNGNAISGHFPDYLEQKNDAVADIISMVPEDKLVFFTAPYCEGGKNRDKFMAALKLRYTKLKDYSSLFDKDETANFVNCGHLNAKGARKFTRYFIKDLQ